MNSAAVQQFLTFTVEREEYGIDIMTVREIKGWTEATRLPGTPECIRGVINLRGVIIPVVDLRSRFGLGMTEATAKHVVIVLAVHGKTLGLLVDTVSDILEANTDQIKPAPASEAEQKDQCVGGLIARDDRMVVLLAAPKLFDMQLLKTADAVHAA